jgi:hypothetical protein
MAVCEKECVKVSVYGWYSWIFYHTYFLDTSIDISFVYGVFNSTVSSWDCKHQMVGWLAIMTCEGCGRKWFGQICSNVSSCDWWTEESNEIPQCSIVGVLAKNWTGHLLNTSQKYYHMSHLVQSPCKNVKWNAFGESKIHAVLQTGWWRLLVICPHKQN